MSVRRRPSRDIFVDFGKYRGRHIVIFRNRIVADGASSTEALENASKKIQGSSRENFILFFVPKEPLFIYLIS